MVRGEASVSYHKFHSGDGSEYGSFEVFYYKSDPASDSFATGWYWQPCFPGCIPDGPPNGPFETEQAAIEAANEV